MRRRHRNTIFKDTPYAEARAHPRGPHPPPPSSPDCRSRFVSSPFLPGQPQSQGQGHTRILWICPHYCSGKNTAFLSWTESTLTFCKKSFVILPPLDGKQWRALKQGQQERDTEAAWESHGSQLHFPAQSSPFPRDRSPAGYDLTADLENKCQLLREQTLQQHWRCNLDCRSVNSLQTNRKKSRTLDPQE